MIDDHHVIEHSCTSEQWAEFERTIEVLQPVELAAIAARLGINLTADDNWHDFLNEFSRQSWRDFTEAYSYEMRTDYVRTEPEPTPA